MYSFKFYYLEACECLKIRQNEKILSRTEENTNDTNLNLSNIELTDDTCRAIGHALRKDVFLQELDLNNCMLSDNGLLNILSGLEANKFLLTLNLKGNNIRSAGTASIGKLLRHNNHLQNLYLEWNSTGIFPEKFCYLCEGLSVNTSLKFLDLRNNQLNHLCAQSLSDVIYRNSTLQYLDIRWNSIGLIGGKTILKTLSKNKSILKLDIAGNDIPSEIQRSIEFITTVNAERYLKTDEDMKKTRLFASKFQQLEGERDKQLKALKDQLEKKDKVIESTERWNLTKLNELQETLLEKDKIIDNLTRKSHELHRRNSVLSHEKNDTAMNLNEMEVKHKELKKELNLLLERKMKEKDDTDRKFAEELGILKEENLDLKQKIQDLEMTKENLNDQVRSLKNTISKSETSSKLEEKSHQEQISMLSDSHQESLKQYDQLRKSEIMKLKEEFSETEKNLKERITHLENRRRDLEQQIIEKGDLLIANKAKSEKTVNELKKKMKGDEDKLRKQMEDRIELLESANKKQEELLKENLDAFYEIQKKSTETDLLLAEELHRTQQLEHMLKAKEGMMDASIAKVKLEVKEELNKLYQDNNSLKSQIEEIEKQHEKQIQSKDEEIKNLQSKIQLLKMKLKEILQNEKEKFDELLTALTLHIKSVIEKDIGLDDEFM